MPDRQLDLGALRAEHERIVREDDPEFGQSTARAWEVLALIGEVEETRRPRHEWDSIRNLPTVIEEVPTGSRGVHESVLRSFRVLREAKVMLDRGDSVETVREFIRWAES